MTPTFNSIIDLHSEQIKKDLDRERTFNSIIDLHGW